MTDASTTDASRVGSSPTDASTVGSAMAAATRALAEFAVGLRDEGVSGEIGEHARLLLLDLFAVTAAGARTPELRRWLDAPRSPGVVRCLGSDVRGTAEDVAFVDAVAACCLELDEGNKHAAGHPAAHVVFAAMAAARLAGRPVTGTEFLAAFAAGYEVAARFGRALTQRPGWHVHGHWGATGAAAAAALLLGGDATEVAAAVDASGALMQVTRWDVVLDGGFARNLWMGGANRAGLEAARLAVAGLVANTGALRHSLDGVIGDLDVDRLARGLGDDWLILGGYLKRHSACSYTHPAVDGVQALRDGSWDPREIAEITVRTNRLAGALVATTRPTSRLAAMFSLPFVTAMAAVGDGVSPASMLPGGEAFTTAEELSSRVHVEVAPELDALLPGKRATEVAIRLESGDELAIGVPNPVGDADHLPLGQDDVLAKATALIGRPDALRVLEVVDAVPTAPDVADLFASLP